MLRSTPRLVPLIVSATVPVTLLSGCSSWSGGGSGGAPPSSSSSSAAPARYRSLPDACAAIPRATVRSMVPGSRKPNGTSAQSGEPKSSGGCSWNGLTGYQYRYLDNAFQRFDNVSGFQSGEDQARSAYRAAVQETAHATRGTRTVRLGEVGDEASLVSWDTTKDHARYHNSTVVVRSANAVLTVDYISAGLQGDRGPRSDGIDSDAQRAAKEALAALR